MRDPVASSTWASLLFEKHIPLTPKAEVTQALPRRFLKGDTPIAVAVIFCQHPSTVDCSAEQTRNFVSFVLSRRVSHVSPSVQLVNALRLSVSELDYSVTIEFSLVIREERRGDKE